MQILILNYEFPPLGGGAGNALFYLLKEYSDHPDLQIHVVTSSENEYKEVSFADNIRIYFLDISKKNSRLHYQTNKDLLTYSYKSYFFCKKLLKTNHYDLCHAFFGIPCGFIAAKLALPYLVSLRGSDVPFYNQRFYWLDRLLLSYLSRKIWKKAARVVANSQGLKELALKNSPQQKIDVIYNGIDTGQFHPCRTDSDTLRVLCISRLIQRKGVEYLIRAMAQLSSEPVHLTIVGKGDQEETLKNLTSDLGLNSRIEFKEYADHNSIAQVYQNNDIFILPSLNEGMSNAVLEAMGCGLPVITTETGGTSELIDGNGFIIEKKSAASVANSLRKFLNDKHLLLQMGNRSREIALNMRWENVAGSYLQIYRSVLSDPH